MLSAAVGSSSSSPWPLWAEAATARERRMRRRRSERGIVGGRLMWTWERVGLVINQLLCLFGSTEEREVRTGGRRREWKEGLYCNVMTETFLV